MARLTIFVDHPGNEDPPELIWVLEWLDRWKGTVRVANYSSGGWEHLWDVEGPLPALREVPAELRCDGAWVDADPSPGI